MLQCLSTADCHWCPDTTYAGQRGWGGTGSGELEQQQQHVGGEVWWDAVGWVTFALGVAPVIVVVGGGGTLTSDDPRWPAVNDPITKHRDVALCVYSHGLTGSDSGSRDTYCSLMSGTGGCISAHWSGCLGGYYWVLRVDWCSCGAKHSTSGSN